MILKNNFRKLNRLLFTILFLAVLLIGYTFQVSAAEPTIKQVKTSGEAMALRVAPGELLPISVKLVNFGGGKKIDVTINYQILDSNNTVEVDETETVAVETTASFIRNIQIPNGLPPGKYTAISNISYEGQEIPATSKFQFTVEKKIAGIFVSQLILYGIIILLVGVAFAIVSRLLIKHRQASRITPHEYPDVPKQDRLFYEIISDVIMQMHHHIGDKALEIARNIDGLVINKNNGRVLEINKDPAEIVALLLLQYEKNTGKKMSFAPRKIDEKTKSNLRPVEKNLNIIAKYF